MYQRVYDPIKKCLVPNTAYGPDIDPSQLDFAGPYVAVVSANLSDQ